MITDTERLLSELEHARKVIDDIDTGLISTADMQLRDHYGRLVDLLERRIASGKK